MGRNVKITAQQFGRTAEDLACQLFRLYGRAVTRMRRGDSFDMLVDGKKIELKAAHPQTHLVNRSMFWLFNFHRHGKITLTKPDYYLVRCENVPCCRNVLYFLFSGDNESQTLRIGMHGLLAQRYAVHARMFEQLRDGLPIENEKRTFRRIRKSP